MISFKQLKLGLKFKVEPLGDYYYVGTIIEIDLAREIVNTNWQRVSSQGWFRNIRYHIYTLCAEKSVTRVYESTKGKVLDDYL